VNIYAINKRKLVNILLPLCISCISFFIFRRPGAGLHPLPGRKKAPSQVQQITKNGVQTQKKKQPLTETSFTRNGQGLFLRDFNI
jgi:hypothetical protein